MVEITPEMGEGMGPDGETAVPPVQETFWDKVLRFFKGLLGLDSGSNTPGEIIPTEEFLPSNGIPKG